VRGTAGPDGRPPAAQPASIDTITTAVTAFMFT